MRHLSPSCSRILAASFVAASLGVGVASAQVSWFVPVDGDVYDLVWDPHRDVLYFGRESGAVGVYDPAAKQMLPEFPAVGVQIRGMDITAEGDKLFVADRWRPPSTTTRYLRVVDLQTREVRSIPFTAMLSSEGGSWDVALQANGWGIVTTEFLGSGDPAARRVNTAGEWIEFLPDPTGGPFLRIDGDSRATASPDRSFVHVIAPTVGKFMFNYDVAVPIKTMIQDLSSAAVYDPSFSRDGSQIASYLGSYGFGYGLHVIRSDDFGLVSWLGNQRFGGFEFDRTRDRLYAGDSWNAEVVAYSTLTWSEQWRVGIPNVFSSNYWETGQYEVSSDGHYLFVSRQEPFGLNTGFFVIDLDSFECEPDLTTTAIPGQAGYGSGNGIVNNDDFFYFLSQFAAGNLAVCDMTASAIAGSPGYGAPNGVLNNDDFFYYLGSFAAGC